MNYWTESNDNIYVAAHRGWSSVYPENTMAAFRAACELGVDQVETDIHVSADGELVLIHDDLLDRTTNGTGPVGNLTLKELRELDAGGWKDERFKGEKIPTLREFFEYVKQSDRLTVDLELKEYATPGREALAYDVCDRTLQMAEEYGFGDRLVINTFNGKLHEYIQDKYGSKYRQHVFFPIPRLGKVTRDPYQYAFCCCMFSTFYNKINIADKADCQRMAAMGVEPWAGAGVCDEEGVDIAIDNGMTLITCNNPDLILDLLRRKGRHA